MAVEARPTIEGRVEGNVDVKQDEPPADYEEVHIRAPGDKKRLPRRFRQLPVRLPGKVGEMYDLITSWKWVLVVAVLGTIMLLLGALSGIGIYMVIKSQDPDEKLEPLETSGGLKTTSITVRCREYLEKTTSHHHSQSCVVENLAQDRSVECNILCELMEWWIKVEGKKDDVVSFHYVGKNLLPSDYQIPSGTPCGINATCSVDGRCSRPAPRTNVSEAGGNGISGRWINMCQSGPLPCLQLKNKKIDDITFDNRSSSQAWAKLISMEKCDEPAATAHCEKQPGIVAAALRVQFRRCDTSQQRSLKCSGLPMVIYPCKQCAVKSNETLISENISGECGGDEWIREEDSCVIRCHKDDRVVKVMPDGALCGSSKSKYCLLGTCYDLMSDDAAPLECGK